MKFARTVFLVAGVWGVLVIAPLFFIFHLIGTQDPPPVTHAGFYYGFATTALAWQIAFFVIASDPRRLRPLMIPSFFEKLFYVTAVVVLYLQGRIRVPDLALGGIDLLCGISFLAAFFRVKEEAEN
jgi:hypothetical protein